MVRSLFSSISAWAVFGASEAGFDPAETRFFRKGKGPNSIIDAKANVLAAAVAAGKTSANDDW